MFLMAALITCLSLLITISFKIISIDGFQFTASSILCSVVAGLYLRILRECSPEEQRQVLNQALLALYLFSIGVYILVNLPALENLRANMAYEVFYEDIPRKFFSATLSFALSFYLPFICVRKKIDTIRTDEKQILLLVLSSGLLFFTLNFILLFSDPMPPNFLQLFFNSLAIAIALLLGIGLGFGLFFSLLPKPEVRSQVEKSTLSYHRSLYHYLVAFSVTINLICLACEYRLISLGSTWILVASGILFPLNFMANNLVGELYGYKANLRIIGILLFSELVFNAILTMVMLLPSPDFFDLNLFYYEISPRGIPAASLALICAMGGNAFLLEKFKNTPLGAHRWLRIITANVISNSVLCFVNYSILFVGIYSYEQIIRLALTSWIYKFIITLLSLPLVLRLFRVWSAKKN